MIFWVYPREVIHAYLTGLLNINVFIALCFAVPFKIIYNDGMYSLHYGCFRKDDKGNCLQAEASIYGRQPTIDVNTKQKLYSMFPSLCLSPEYMDDTIHTGEFLPGTFEIN